MRKVKEIRDPLTDEIIYFKTHAGVVRMNNGMTVEDAVNLMINNHKSEDSGDTPEETIYTEDLTIIVDGITEGFIILILSEDGLVLGTQTTNLQTHKINEGVKYYIVANDIEGYIVPNSTEVFTAVKYGYREISMVYEKYKITTIQIDQTISDTANIITRIIDNGGIEAIRANSHRYTGQVVDGVMTLKLLDDNDGTKYLDGSDAEISTPGIDVWMRLPQFYYKCEEISSYIYNISFAYNIKPDENYNEWDGKDLIGVYKGSSAGGYIYSYYFPGLTPSITTHSVSYNNAKNRGTGYSGVKWKHHCMMYFLFCAYYNTTIDTSIFGLYSGYRNFGTSNSLGMRDSTPSDSGVNFWGLEDWYGNRGEFISNVSYSSSTFNITEDDGTKTSCTGNGFSSNYPYVHLLKILNNNLYYIPVTMSSTVSLFPGAFSMYEGTAFRRASNGSMFYVRNWNTGWSNDNDCGSRLTYRGEIVIES